MDLLVLIKSVRNKSYPGPSVMKLPCQSLLKASPVCVCYTADEKPSSFHSWSELLSQDAKISKAVVCVLSVVFYTAAIAVLPTAC